MSLFNVSFIVWPKSKESVHKPQFLKRKEKINTLIHIIHTNTHSSCSVVKLKQIRARAVDSIEALTANFVLNSCIYWKPEFVNVA